MKKIKILYISKSKLYKEVAIKTNHNKLETYFKNLGLLVSKFRKEKGFSLEELGMQIGIDRSAMHRIENGKPITVTTLIKLCLALDKRPKDFFSIDFDFEQAELGGLVKAKKSSKKKTDSKPKKTVKKKK